MVKKKLETADMKNEMETPEKTIVNHSDTKVVSKTDTVIVFQAKHRLAEHEYEWLQSWIRKENEATGLKIVLAPYSVDVQVGEADGKNNK